MIDKRTLKKWNRKYLEGIEEDLKPTDSQIWFLWNTLNFDGSSLTKYRCSDIISILKNRSDRYDSIDEVEDRYFEYY